MSAKGAPRFDIVIEESSQFELSFELLQPGTCDPIDVDAYGALMEIRDAPDGTLVIAASTANGRITIDTINDRFNIIIEALDIEGEKTDFQAWTEDGYYDVFTWPTAADPDTDRLIKLWGRVKYKLNTSEP